MDRHIGFGGLEKQLRFGDGRDKRADDVTTAAGQAERESAPLARLCILSVLPSPNCISAKWTFIEDSSPRDWH